MKRWLVALWLLAFALWPLVHRGLVAAYDIEPSRFAGWARHATPAFPLQVALFRIDFRSAKSMDDIKVMAVPRSQWSPELTEEWEDYRERREAFGRLARAPDALGNKLLTEHGDTGMVLVTVFISTLDHSTKTVDVKTEKYPYSARQRLG